MGTMDVPFFREESRPAASPSSGEATSKSGSRIYCVQYVLDNGELVIIKTVYREGVSHLLPL